MATSASRPPALIFAGYPPFPELRAFLRERYLPSRLVPSMNGLGLWVEARNSRSSSDSRRPRGPQAQADEPQSPDMGPPHPPLRGTFSPGEKG